MHVSRPRSTNPIFEAFCKAGEEAGYPRTIDFNGESQVIFPFFFIMFFFPSPPIIFRMFFFFSDSNSYVGWFRCF